MSPPRARISGWTIVKILKGKFRPEPASHRKKRDETRAIFDFNRSLTLIVDSDALVASIAARIREIFDPDRIAILSALGESAISTVSFSAGYAPGELAGAQIAQHGKLAKWLLTNEASLVVDANPGVFDYLSPNEQELLRRLQVRICVPLIALNRLTGLILLSSSKSDWMLSEEELGVLEMLASHASIAVENAYLYQEQRDRLRRLYRAERLAAAGQLAASVAHEIRNPLTAIRSTVQYLLGEFPPGHPKRALFDGVISEVDRIDRTVGGLLSLTRHHEFKAERLALTELVGQSLILVKNQARNQSVGIEWIKPAEAFEVMGDSSQLRQVMLNLLLNALQAMPNGGTLKVEFLRAPRTIAGSEKGWAEISLTDSGCGISAGNLDKIFDPFFTTKQGGTGLGLSISYSIVRQHGGELEIHSQENEGTTVALRIPLV